MIKGYIKERFKDMKPAGYIHKLAVCKNEICDLIAEFEKEWIWCSGCQDYVKISESKIVNEDGRNVVRCSKCNDILKFVD